MENVKKYYLKTLIIFAVAVIYTILVMVVDVQPIGPLGSEVGFASINGAVFSFLGTSDFWMHVTKVVTVFPFVVCGFFAMMGLWQLIQTKSFKKVRTEIYLLACFYILCFIVYFFFEIVVINYRPILEEGELAASFPSSHSCFCLCAMLSSIIMIEILFPTYKKVLMIYDAFSAIVCVLILIGRLAAGVHWFTDIIGAILYSTALVSMFRGTLSLFADRAENVTDQS